MKIQNKDKLITGIISLCLVFAIFGIGYLGITSITHTVSTNSEYSANNLTSSYISSSDSVTGVLLPLLIIGAVCLISTLLFYSVSSSQRFEKIGKSFKFIITTTYYFGYGVIFIIILAVPSYLLYMLYNFAVVEGNVVVTYETLKWLLVAVGAFFGIGGVGYIFKTYFVDKLRLRLEELTEDEEEPKEGTTA